MNDAPHIDYIDEATSSIDWQALSIYFGVPVHRPTHGERVLIAAATWLKRKKHPCTVKHIAHATELHKQKVKRLLISMADQGRLTLGNGRHGGMAVTAVLDPKILGRTDDARSD